MRLFYPDPHPVPDACTESLQILYTADALGRAGIELTLMTPAPADGIAADSILGHPLSPQVHLVPCAARYPRWLPGHSNRPFYRAVARRLAAEPQTVVYARNLKLAEYLLRALPGLTLFFETHELFAQSLCEEHPQAGWRQRRKIAALARREGYVYRHARGLIALTPLLIEDIRRTYGVNTPAIVAPDGVDLEQANACPTPMRNETPMLLYLGSLHPWKGVETLIHAMAHVGHAAALHIVGGHSKRIEALRRLAQGLGVAPRIVFHGPVDPGERFRWIHRADICLLPLTETSIASRYTSPLKLFEYMAAGKPIVVADVPAIRTVATPGVHLLAAEVGNPRSFAAAIDQLLTDSALCQRLGIAARKRAYDFTWTMRAQKITSFFSQLLCDPGLAEIAGGPCVNSSK